MANSTPQPTSNDAASDNPIKMVDAQSDGANYDDEQLWQGRISRAEAAQQKFFTKCADWYDLMHARVQDDDWGWHSRYFDPILASKTWSLVAKIVAGESGWMVKSGDDETPYVNGVAMQAALKYFERNPELDSAMQEKWTVAGIDSVVCGAAYIKTPWTIKKKVSTSRIIDKGGALTGKTKEKTFYLRYPDAINISVGDLLHSPAVAQSSIQKSPYLIFRSYTTKDELDRMNEAQGGDYYTNLDEVQGFGDFDSLTRARNRLLNTQVDSTLKQVEIHECWEKGLDPETKAECVWITVLANRKVVIKPKSKSPFWHGKYPVAKFVIKPRGFSIEGEGIFETNERGQWTINDTTNHQLDAWNIANNPMVIQDKDTVVDSYQVAPGAQFLYKSNAGSAPPTPFMFPQPNSDSYIALNERIGASIETNSISSYQSGTPIDAADKTEGTKGGTQDILAAGDDQLGFYRQNFLQGVREVGMMWMQLIQQYQDDPIITEIMVPKVGKTSVKITPDQLQGELHLELDETSLQSTNKDTDRQNFDTFVNRLIQIQPVAQASPSPIAVDWTGVIKDMGEKYGAADAEKYVTKVQAPQQPAQPTQPQMTPQMIQAIAEAKKSPEQRILENVSLDKLYAESPPDVQAQILQSLGFKPSQMLTSDHVDSIKNRVPNVPPTDINALNLAPPGSLPQPGMPMPGQSPAGAPGMSPLPAVPQGAPMP